MRYFEGYSFEDLLDALVNPPSNHHYQQAWMEFLERYRFTIESAARHRCRGWNARSLDMQLSDVVNDVISDVLLILCKKDCKALADFRGRDSEEQFKGWLRVVASRAAGRRLKNKAFQRVIITDEDGERNDLPDYVIKDYLSGLERDQVWELYEDWVHTIRDVKGSRKGNTERDIHIFMLYTLSDFTQEMICDLPGFADPASGEKLGHRVVDNVVNRLRNLLKEHWDIGRFGS